MDYTYTFRAVVKCVANCAQTLVAPFSIDALLVRITRRLTTFVNIYDTHPRMHVSC